MLDNTRIHAGQRTDTKTRTQSLSANCVGRSAGSLDHTNGAVNTDMPLCCDRTSDGEVFMASVPSNSLDRIFGRALTVTMERSNSTSLTHNHDKPTNHREYRTTATNLHWKSTTLHTTAR